MTLQTTLRFAVDLPRFRWELGVVDGVECLVPCEALPSSRFTGGSDVFDFLRQAAGLDDQGLLEFVSQTSGLFLEDGIEPRPEQLLRLRWESAAFEHLWLLRSTRLVWIEKERWARGSVRAPHRRADPAVEWMNRATDTLRGLLATLRPGYAAGNLPVELSQEAVTLAWLDATAREHWSAGIPLGPWGMAPMSERAIGLAPVDPVIRCRTMLGYGYAQLLIAFDERRRTLEFLREGGEVTGKCRGCGVELDPLTDSGRKRRKDAKWCEGCRRRENNRVQHERRQKAGQMPP